MEATQDQLFFTRVDVDIANSKNTRDIGGELFGVNLELFSLDVQTPLRNRSEFGAQTKKHQQHIEWHQACDPVCASHLDAGECALAFFMASNLANHELHLKGIAQRFHLGHAGRCGLEAVAPVDQDHALGFVRAVFDKIQCPVQR